jgi:hypothetical protein
MAQSTLFVGMDVHQDTVTVSVLPEQSPEAEETRTLPHDLGKLRKYFARLSKRGEQRSCYEASGCGYVLQRALVRWGVACEVIAPSLDPGALGGPSQDRQAGRGQAVAAVPRRRAHSDPDPGRGRRSRCARWCAAARR